MFPRTAATSRARYTIAMVILSAARTAASLGPVMGSALTFLTSGRTNEGFGQTTDDAGCQMKACEFR